MVFDLCTSILFSKIIPFLLALLGIGFLITFHEFGHFIMCKLFGIHTPTFSIGFGPEIISRKIGSTHFRIAAIPLGGYVEIAGSNEPGQGDQEFAHVEDETSFNTKPYWQKLLVLMGGITCNMLFAYIVFISIYFFGIPQEIGTIVVQGIEKESAAESSLLKKGDVILGIDDASFSTKPKDLIKEMQTILLSKITTNPNGNITLHIKRDDKPLDLPVQLGKKEQGGKIIGSLGAAFGMGLDVIKDSFERYPFVTAVKMGVERTHSYVFQIFGFFKSMVTKQSLKGAGGPIMIISMTFSMAQKGLVLFLIFLAIISINLAVLNMLPLGIVDGGQILLVTIESITGRKLPESVKIGIALSFWALFLTLTLVLSYRDILLLLGY